MKKLLAVLLAVIMLVALLAACGGGGATEAPKTIEKEEGEDVFTATKNEGKQLLAIIIPKSMGSSWFARSEMGGDQWAEDTGNLSQMVGSNVSDVAVQIQSIQDALALNPDFISVIPLSPEACETVFKEAMKNGVIVTTQEASNIENAHYDVEAFNNADYGAHFFEKAQTMDGPWKKDKGKYVLFVQLLTAPTHNQWAEGLKAYVVKNYPQWELFSNSQIEGIDGETVFAKTKEILQADPDIDFFWGGNGGDPASMGRAIDELGLNGVKFVTGTGMPLYTESGLRNGSVQFCSFWDPYETQYVCNVISSMVLDGKSVKTGDNMGRLGYNSVVVDGLVVMGAAWIDVTTENFEKYNFI